MIPLCPICSLPIEGETRTATIDNRVRSVHGACVGARPAAKGRGKAGSARAPRPRRDEEGAQIRLFGWLAIVEAATGSPDIARIVHVPNGGKRGKAEAGRLRAGGVRRGVPDLVAFVARERGGRLCPGLAVELKEPGGTVSDEQENWLAHLASEGWETGVAWSPEDAFARVVDYLGLAWEITNGRPVRLMESARRRA